MILVGPTGSVVRGDVLDVSKAGLEAALKAYDPQLYLKWNPKKLGGHGVWEVRRAPEEKSAIFHGEFNGGELYSIEEFEVDMIAHIMDVPYLNYSVVERLKSMDQWAKSGMRHRKDTERASSYVSAAVQQEKVIKAKEEQAALDDAYYGMKQEKRALKELREVILRGENPNNLARFWK